MDRNEVIKNLCPLCMSDKIENGVCKHCKTAINAIPKPYSVEALPIKSVLAERYVIGAVRSETTTTLIYYAYDLLLQKPVIIECGIGINARMDYYTSAMRKTEEMQKKVLLRIAMAAGLEEEGVITYTDSFEYEDCYYLVSDYYEGLSLRHKLDMDNKRYRVVDTIAFLKKLAKPLKAMHERDIICCTLTPERIFIMPDSSVRVLDAEPYTVYHSDIELREKMPVSPVIPSEFYMKGYVPDESFDVYSVAAIAYRMIAGVDIALAKEREYTEELANPVQYGANIPESAFAVFNSALSVYAEDRIQTVDEFIIALETELEGVIELENDMATGKSIGLVCDIDDAMLIACDVDNEEISDLSVESTVVEADPVVEAYDAAVEADDTVIETDDTVVKTHNSVFDDEDQVVEATDRLSPAYETLQDVEQSDSDISHLFDYELETSAMIGNDSSESQEQENVSPAESQEKPSNEQEAETDKKPKKQTEDNREAVETGKMPKKQAEENSEVAETGKMPKKQSDDSDAEKAKRKAKPEGIHPAVKVCILSIIGILLVIVTLAFMGVVEPAVWFAKKTVEVPDICGMTVEQAKQTLMEAGFNILVEEAYQSEYKSNDVFKQRPTAQSMAVRGDLVCVTVSTGSNEDKEGVMPNLVYMQLSGAFKKLYNKCKINIELAESDDIMVGCVIKQSEYAGVAINKDTVVTLTVSTGSLLQNERIKISESIDKAKAAVIFMEEFESGDELYTVRLLEDGTALGSMMPQPPSPTKHNNLEFIGWSRGKNGTNGEFTKDSLAGGVMVVYSFFADRGSVIATPTPAPTYVIEEVTPTPLNIVTPEQTETQTEYVTVEPTSTVIVFTPTPTPSVTEQPTEKPTPKPTEQPTEKPTEQPTEQPTEKPTPTPKPTEQYYLEGIEFEYKEITIEVGGRRSLEINFLGNPKSKRLSYRSSNSNIATISDAGTAVCSITARAVGETNVYAVYNGSMGLYEAVCHIIVVEANGADGHFNVRSYNR